MYARSYVEKDPRRWKVEENGMRLKGEFGNESLIKVDYNCTDAYMSMYIRESIYRNLLSGKYNVSSECTKTLVILDENGEEISPLSKDCIY